MIAALGFLAAALSITVIWPQVWLSCRRGRTQGLSPTACWLAIALNLCWLTFGLLIGDPAQIVTNVVVGAGNAAILTALLVTQPHLRSGPLLLRSAIGPAGLAALATGSLIAVVVFGAAPAVVATTFGSIIALVGAVAALPQPLSLLLDRTQDVSGLSTARWRLGAGSCASWVSYGWMIHQPMMWLSAGFGLCCAVLVCTMLRARRTAGASGAFAELTPAVTLRRAGELVCPAHARTVLVAA